MRITLDIDLDALGAEPASEAGRILRYWAGALGQLDLRQPASFPLMDSGYQQVGSLEIESTDAHETPGDVKNHLHNYLSRQHEVLMWKLDGVSERDARWPMTPTGTNLLGLLKHVATVEAEYFGLVFDRPFPEVLPWAAEDAEDNADMYAGPEESVASVRAFAERVWAHADATIDALPLDAPGHVPWWGDRGDVTLAQILVHVTAEVARHAGHADIVRELIDGAAGLRDGGSNLPEHDARWWAEYVERLQQVATDAGAQ
ncbi:DinB family protein [Pseudactinotalea terrae]|uniref:DinB family protein n=1 Tax=Pseudactinotalea terrae TaxID=1743262 RepID=UPI001F4FDD17|nr:DinB family protein [Pseudactinotalea terrae]